MRQGTVFVLLAVVVAACGTDPEPTSTEAPAAPTTTVADTAATPTTTTVVMPTTVPETTSSDAPATTTTLDPHALAEFDGCTPGPSDGLPDGEWFGLVVGADADGIVFDLACLFLGDAAATAAAEDGEESPPPNDYHVRNRNPALRTLAAATGATVVYYETGDPDSAVETDYAGWLTSGFVPGSPGVPAEGIRAVVTVVGGDVVGVDEFWTP